MATDINSIMAGWVDRGIWTYYDHITANAGTTLASSYSPFSIPQGQGGKTKLDTNLKNANFFTPPRSLILDNIGLYFQSTMLKADLDIILQNYYLEFRIDDKIFFEGPLWQYSSGCGLFGHSTKTNESAWTLGLPDFRSTMRYGDYAKYIAPLVNFSCILITPNTPALTAAASGGVGLDMYVTLNGLTDRSVQ